MSPKEDIDSLDRKLQAVLAEYNDCRSEIKLRIQERTRMTEFYIVGIVAIAGYAIQTRNYFLMLIASAYAVFIYAMIVGTYFYTDSLAHYVREEIESKKIPHILGEAPQLPLVKESVMKWKTAWLGWETNFEECVRRSNPISRRRVLHLFSWGIISISSISLGYGLILAKIDTPLVVSLALIVLLAYGLIIETVSRKEYPGKR